MLLPTQKVVNKIVDLASLDCRRAGRTAVVGEPLRTRLAAAARAARAPTAIADAIAKGRRRRRGGRAESARAFARGAGNPSQHHKSFKATITSSSEAGGAAGRRVGKTVGPLGSGPSASSGSASPEASAIWLCVSSSCHHNAVQVPMYVIHGPRGRAFEHLDLVVLGQDGNCLGLVHVAFSLELRGAPENRVADRELSTPHRGLSRSGDGAS